MHPAPAGPVCRGGGCASPPCIGERKPKWHTAPLAGGNARGPHARVSWKGSRSRSVSARRRCGGACAMSAPPPRHATLAACTSRCQGRGDVRGCVRSIQNGRRQVEVGRYSTRTQLARGSTPDEAGQAAASGIWEYVVHVGYRNCPPRRATAQAPKIPRPRVSRATAQRNGGRAPRGDPLRGGAGRMDRSRDLILLTALSRGGRPHFSPRQVWESARHENQQSSVTEFAMKICGLN